MRQEMQMLDIAYTYVKGVSHMQASIVFKRAYLGALALAVLATTLATVSDSASAVDWQAHHTPSRKEWIEVSLAKEVSKVTGLWEKRVTVNVMVIEKTETIVIVLGFANGQIEVSPAVCADYIATTRRIAEQYVQQYPWAKQAKIDVACA